MIRQLSGAVEPVAGVLGALAVVTSTAILPYALGFAVAGLDRPLRTSLLAAKLVDDADRFALLEEPLPCS